MKKISQMAQIAVFLLLIVLVPVLYLVTPDKQMSESENRTLAQLPAFSLQSLLSGQYTSEFETYLTDQMPFRDEWIALRSYIEALLLKTESNGVYIGSEQTLIARFDQPDAARVQRNTAALQKLVEKAGVPVYLSLIPGAVQVWQHRLPANAPNADQAALIEQIAAQTQAVKVDILGALNAHRNEDIYYRTDHHWTTLGAYYGYTALAKAMGLSASPLSSFTAQTVSQEFYGTVYSKAGVRWIKPDSMQIMVQAPDAEVLWYDGAAETKGSLYVDSFLGKKDKYSYFLGGNRGRIVVKSGGEGQKLLLLRDSYSDSELPFLLEHFSEIHLLDPRYYSDSVLDYIEQQGIDAVVVNMSVDTFTSERRVALIGQ